MLSSVSPPVLTTTCDLAISLSGLVLTVIDSQLGHSERRTLFHETSEIVAKKTRAALDADLTVILCVGETLEEREAGTTATVIASQLSAVVQLLDEVHWRCVFPPPFSSPWLYSLRLPMGNTAGS